MLIINCIVIYFALGVPFGVLAASHERGRLQPADLWHIFYDLAFWPLLLLRSYFRPVRFDEEPACNLTPDERALRRKLRFEIETLNGLHSALRELDDVRNECFPFAGIVEHPNPQVASKCFQRTNLAKLELHTAAVGARIRSIVSESPVERAQIDILLADTDESIRSLVTDLV